MVDGGELNANESREFFDKLRVKFSLTNASNLEANGKIEWGHGPVVKLLWEFSQEELALIVSLLLVGW